MENKDNSHEKEADENDAPDHKTLNLNKLISEIKTPVKEENKILDDEKSPETPKILKKR